MVLERLTVYQLLQFRHTRIFGPSVKRTRFPRRSKQTPDVEALVRLSRCLGESTSRIEDAYWESKMLHYVGGLLKAGDDEPLNQALDILYAERGPAYDRLADLIECTCEAQGTNPVILLFAAPLLAWSRFTIPAGKIPAEQLGNLRVQLQAHVFADGTKLGLADHLFSPDQLPQGYCETLQLAQRLGTAALHDKDHRIDPGQLPETMNFLSDTRYVLGALSAPAGSALFRWQEDEQSRDEVLKRWRAQGGEALRPLLPACAMETLLPLPFFAACRESDRLSRPYAIRAAVAFLQATLNLASTQIRAVIAPFFDNRMEEYRIGFALEGSDDVVHGVVWPLLEAEDESTDINGQIEAVLRESGVSTIISLDHRFPLEFCDDCGAPLYPNPEGEPVHAEMPETQTSQAPQHLH